MKIRLIIGLFICLSILQIFTPVSMIAKRESVLKSGEQFKFKTAPFDPYDAFRGRYVALRVEEDWVELAKGMKLSNGQAVYALIEVAEQGFAKFSNVNITRPVNIPYIQAKVRYIAGGKVYLDLPIDRYYMEEKAAPKAERIYRQYAQRDKQDAYIIVKVKNGLAVIESLHVGGQRIEEAVRENQ